MSLLLFPGFLGGSQASKHLRSGCRYTLATGLFRDINKCIRDDNEDGLRRLARAQKDPKGDLEELSLPCRSFRSALDRQRPR